MGIGDKLQNLIDEPHRNVNDISKATGISASTIYSIIRRNNTKVDLDVLQTLADELCVTLDYFAENKSSWHPTITSRDLKEINNIIANARDLLHQDGLMFDGKPATDEDIESILSAIEIGLEMAKKKSKEKFTPKKYKEK